MEDVEVAPVWRNPDIDSEMENVDMAPVWQSPDIYYSRFDDIVADDEDEDMIDAARRWFAE